MSFPFYRRSSGSTAAATNTRPADYQDFVCGSSTSASPPDPATGLASPQKVDASDLMRAAGKRRIPFLGNRRKSMASIKANSTVNISKGEPHRSSNGVGIMQRPESGKPIRPPIPVTPLKASGMSSHSRSPELPPLNVPPSGFGSFSVSATPQNVRVSQTQTPSPSSSSVSVVKNLVVRRSGIRSPSPSYDPASSEASITRNPEKTRSSFFSKMTSRPYLSSRSSSADLRSNRHNSSGAKPITPARIRPIITMTISPKPDDLHEDKDLYVSPRTAPSPPKASFDPVKTNSPISPLSISRPIFSPKPTNLDLQGNNVQCTVSPCKDGRQKMAQDSLRSYKYPIAASQPEPTSRTDQFGARSRRDSLGSSSSSSAFALTPSPGKSQVSSRASGDNVTRREEQETPTRGPTKAGHVAEHSLDALNFPNHPNEYRRAGVVIGGNQPIPFGAVRPRTRAVRIGRNEVTVSVANELQCGLGVEVGSDSDEDAMSMYAETIGEASTDLQHSAGCSDVFGMHSSNGSISDASNAASIASAMKLPPSCPPGSRPRIITQHCRDGSAGHTPMRPSISKSFSSVNLRSPTSDRPAHVPAGDKHVLLLPITGDMRMASLATKTVVPSISAMPTIPSFSSAQVVPRTSEEVSHSAFSVSSRQTDAPTRGGCRTPTSMVSTSSTRPLNLHQSTQNTTPSKSNLTPITRPRASSTSSSLREVLANPQYVPNVSSESMSMFKAQNARFDRLANYLLSVIQRHQTEKAQYEERIAAFEMELQKRERELKGLRWLVRNGSMAQEFFDRTTSLDKILSTPSDMGDETDYLRTPLADLEAVAASISCPIKLGRSDSDHSPRIRQGQGEKPVGMLKRSNTMPEMLPGTLHKISTPETSPSGKTFGGLGLDFPLPGPLSLSSISSTIFSTTSTANASTSGDPNMASSGLSTIEESAHHSRLVPRNYGIPELSDERPVSGYSLSSTDSSLQHLPSSQVELDNSQSGKSSSYSSGLAHMEEMYDRLVGLSTKMRENAHGSSESLTTR